MCQMCPVTRCPLFSGLYKRFHCSTNIVVFVMQWKYVCVSIVNPQHACAARVTVLGL